MGINISHYLYFVALGMALLACWLAYRRVVAVLSGDSVEGVVTAHERREMDDSVGYHPTVCFVDHTGTERKFTSNSGSSQPKPKIGTRVRVVYLRTNPSVAFIASFFHMWAAPIAFALLAFAALLGARALQQ